MICTYCGHVFLPSEREDPTVALLKRMSLVESSRVHLLTRCPRCLFHVPIDRNATTKEEAGVK